MIRVSNKILILLPLMSNSSEGSCESARTVRIVIAFSTCLPTESMNVDEAQTNSYTNQLHLILTALLHADLINIGYLRHVPLSGHDDVALFE